MIYYTFDTYGHYPLKVNIVGKNVTIYKYIGVDETGRLYSDKGIHFKCKKIFIGENKLMSTKKYRGNSILLQISDYRYINLSYDIMEFRTEDKIIHYQSDLNDGGFSYSFAVDNSNNYYLITGKIILHSETKLTDPYKLYYKGVRGKTFKDFIGYQKLLMKNTNKKYVPYKSCSDVKYVYGYCNEKMKKIPIDEYKKIYNEWLIFKKQQKMKIIKYY